MVTCKKDCVLCEVLRKYTLRSQGTQIGRINCSNPNLSNQPRPSVVYNDAMINPPIKIGNKYKVFLAPIKETIDLRKHFHEKVVRVTAISRLSPTYVFVKVVGKETQGWLDTSWLFTIDPQGKCICETGLLVTQGCKCGGI
jgi:hypothetical protein